MSPGKRKTIVIFSKVTLAIRMLIMLLSSVPWENYEHDLVWLTGGRKRAQVGSQNLVAIVPICMRGRKFK